MLTSFQIVKVGHASRLKKSSGFNSAQAVREHCLKEAKSSQNRNILRLNLTVASLSCWVNKRVCWLLASGLSVDNC